MKIALLGYGKMGKTIETIATQRGHEIVIKADKDSPDYDITSVDIAIEFSTPSSAFANISNALLHGIPVVAGTTGWLSDLEKAKEICEQQRTGFIYASNFSIGVNLFFELNKKLAAMMSPFSQYAVSVEEIHHIHKLDAPSGTAITLAEGIIQESDKTEWILGQASEQQVPITAFREGETPGTHSIFYKSHEDTIEIKHTAHSRQGFALGAVIAAEWLLGKKGFFTMKDVLSL